MKNILTRFFKPNETAGQPAASESPTLPVLMEAPTEQFPQPVACYPRQLLLGTGQSVGRQRDHNEDALFALNAVMSNEGVEIPFGIFVVADGMGGHQHGEVASQIAIRTITDFLMKKLYFPLLGADTEPQAESLHDIICKGFELTQQNVTRQVPGGGTTLTTAIVINDKVTLAHVGDSRAYFVSTPDQRIEVKTRDHSLVQRLVDLKQITQDEAFHHPQKNMLYQAIGQSEPVQPDINTFDLPVPGCLMVCSDGLWGVVPDKEMLEIISAGQNPSLTCRDLVKAANEGGGPDNISVILVQTVP
jgi:PPM family protein phosphatase